MLPFLTDINDVHRFLKQCPTPCDAHIAYLAAFLSKEGLPNREVRAILGIDKVYALTHFKRVGLSLTEDEFQLWEKNPTRITLGHLRLLAGLSPSRRHALIRHVIATGVSVARLSASLKSTSQEAISDIKQYSLSMEDALGRGVSISFDIRKQSGEITLKFYGLDDLDMIAKKLGYVSSDS